MTNQVFTVFLKGRRIRCLLCFKEEKKVGVYHVSMGKRKQVINVFLSEGESIWCFQGEDKAGRVSKGKTKQVGAVQLK